jgi:two-component system nitrogen regulation sensor histidine kinase GlnL
MTKSAYTLLGLTAIVAALSGVLAFVVLRAFAAARSMAMGRRENTGSEAAFMTAAMEEALARLRLREQALAARAEASERLSDEIIASLTSGLLVVGDDHRVKSVNPAGRRLLGMAEGDWTGAVGEVLLGAAAPLARVIEECLKTGEPVRRRTVSIVTRDDRPTHLGVSVSPIGAVPGSPNGAICLFSDLTDIFELEGQLRLKESLAQVGELTAGIAHEFRNGLATIHGYARLLELDRLTPDMRPYVQGIRDETDTLGAVVRNFLNFAKPAELVLGTVETRTIVDRAADDIRAEVKSLGGEVTVRGEFPVVAGDEVLLKQALSNLCRNALEACSEAKKAPHITIEGVADRAQRVARIAVIDNGPGVDPAVASRIFRPFVTTRARGTGLGLAVVQKIVVTHNGRVAAQPEPGGGARFTVTLPLADGSAA